FRCKHFSQIFAKKPFIPLIRHPLKSVARQEKHGGPRPPKYGEAGKVHRFCQILNHGSTEIWKRSIHYSFYLDVKFTWGEFRVFDLSKTALSRASWGKMFFVDPFSRRYFYKGNASTHFSLHAK
ncbi:MAG: hypothetical protein KJ893_09355, partial [Candidatus Omnitrophica bacterium]|nr:hypothetical protein [Candidatus Omnitrophota bacterium]